MNSPCFCLIILFMALSIAAPAQGFFKYLGTTPLVANPDPRTVYLFQFPRIAHVPTSVYYFSALNTKVETWLSLQGIKFHRVSNLAALSSKQKGVVPFALLNGKFYEGSDEIIEEVDRHFSKYKYDSEEKQLRRTIDDKLFKILMVDRVTRDEQGQGGLDWYLEDEAIMGQVVPPLHPKMDFALKLHEVDYVAALNPQTWSAYFDVYTVTGTNGAYYRHGKCPQGARECVEPKKVFMEKCLKKANGENADIEFAYEDWEEFSRKLKEKIILPILKEAFTEVKNLPIGPDAEKQLKDLLGKHFYFTKTNEFLPKEKPMSYLIGKGEEAWNYLKTTLRPSILRLRRSGQFLFGNEPTPADASLFAILVQFFETPLNIPEFKQFFQAPEEELSVDARVLKAFVVRIKNKLGLGEEGWAKLAQKPWTLNYEQKKFTGELGEKYDGPFSVPNVNGMFLEGDFSMKAAPEEIQFVMAKIAEFVDTNKWLTVFGREKSAAGTNEEIKNWMFQAMAAYLCKSPPKKGLWGPKPKNCEDGHLAMLDRLQIVNATEMFKITRQITYDTIVAYNDRKNIGLMWRAIRESAVEGAKGDWYNPSQQVASGYVSYVFGFLSGLCSASSFVVYLTKHEEIRVQSAKFIRRLLKRSEQQQQKHSTIGAIQNIALVNIN